MGICAFIFTIFNLTFHFDFNSLKNDLNFFNFQQKLLIHYVSIDFIINT